MCGPDGMLSFCGGLSAPISFGCLLGPLPLGCTSHVAPVGQILIDRTTSCSPQVHFGLGQKYFQAWPLYMECWWGFQLGSK